MNDRPRVFDLVVLAPLGFAVLAYQLAEPGEVVPPIAMVACIAGRAIQDLTGWVLGKATIALAVLLAIVYVITDVARLGFEVTIFADFMMILAALKSVERRTPRDDGQLLVVSIFVALAAAVSSNRMGTGLLLVVYVFSLMLAVMRVQIDAALWPEQPRRRGGLWTLLGGCVLGSTAVAMVAFMLLPRSNARFSPVGLSPVTQQVSGFRESVSLGRGGLISQDPREVMRVSIVDRLGEVSTSFQEGEVLYLRGRVLAEYEQGSGAGRWTPAEDASLWNETPVRNGTHVTVAQASDFRTLRIIQHAGASGSGTVFTVWKPTRVQFDLARGEALTHRLDLSMKFETPPGESIEYRMTFGRSPAQTFSRAAAGPIAASGSDIIRDTASRVLSESGIEPERSQRPFADDAQAIAALESWLRSEKGYTLDIEPAPPGRDPTEWFIEEGTRGHCEYFASALALLCRDVGIRARVVTGYLALAEAGETESIRVRRSDAHAWVEAEIEPGVWRTFDATPAASGGAVAAQVDPITRWLSSLESVWLTSFISFDARSQSRLSRSLDRAFSIDRIRARSDETGGSGSFGRRWIPVVAGLAVATGCVIALVRLRRRGSGDHAGGVYSLPQAAIEARDALERAWREAEMPRPRGVTLRGHAVAVDPSALGEVDRIERLAFRSE